MKIGRILYSIFNLLADAVGLIAQAQLNHFRAVLHRRLVMLLSSVLYIYFFKLSLTDFGCQVSSVCERYSVTNSHASLLD